MKISSILLFVVALAVSTSVRAQTSGPGGEGVAVGTSDLIGTLQDSDSFDISSGSRNGQSYSPQGYPLSGQQYEVQSQYNGSVPASSANEFGGGDQPFSIATDASYYGSSPYNPYPGSSGAGSANGFTQSGLGGGQGNAEVDFGIAYGLSDNFIVQFDAVQVNDRIDINIGNSNNTIGSSDGLSVFFRQGSLGIFNGTVGGETLTGFDPGTTDNTWNNYAVDFNLTAKTLTLYANEVDLGTVDLTTFAGGKYASVLDADSNDYVSIGGAESTTADDPSDIGLLWTDNFQVGTAAPEPTTWAMLLGGLGLLVGLGRLRRLNG